MVIVLYSAIAFIIGSISWSGISLIGVSLVWLVPILIFSNRAASMIIAFAYYYGAMWSTLAPAASQYLAQPFYISQLMVIAASAINALLLTLPNYFIKSRSIALGLGMLLTSLPIVGIVGGVNPLLVSGLLFPAVGWAGLIICFITWCLVFNREYRIAGVVIMIMSSSFANTVYEPAEATGIVGLNTNYDFQAVEQWRPLNEYMQWSKTAAKVNLEASDFLVLPEGSAAFLDSSMIAKLDPSKTVLAGVLKLEPPLENTINLIKSGNITRLYAQRVPIPVGMWRPWSDLSYPLNLTAKSVADIAGKKFGFFICHEAMLVWPWVQTLLENPDYLVVIGNGNFSRSTRLSEVQRHSALLWSRLFNKPLVWAYNY